MCCTSGLMVVLEGRACPNGAGQWCSGRLWECQGGEVGAGVRGAVKGGSSGLRRAGQGLGMSIPRVPNLNSI